MPLGDDLPGIPRELWEEFQSSETYLRIIRGESVAQEDWKKLKRVDRVRVWLYKDPAVDVESLRKQGRSEDDIPWIQYPYRAAMLDATASPGPLYRAQAYQHWMQIAWAVEYEPWASIVPDELQRPWTDSISEERQLELWAHADPDVDVPTLMQQARISYQDAVLGKYPYRRAMMTLGRPSVDAQVRYRDMMTGKLHEARLQVGAAAPSRREMVSINQTINNYGDGAVLSQAARDSIVKHVHTGAGRAELRQVFDELRAAIGDVVDDEEDRQVRIETIDDLERELNAETPRKTWVQKFWNGAIWAATVEGAIQGGERVGRALVALRPYVQPWFEELPPIPPELLGAMA